MPKLEFFLVAESVSIDRDTNQISIFNVLEEVAFSKSSDHWAIPKLVVCSSWICEQADLNKDFQVGVEIVQPNPEGVTEAAKQFSANFTASSPRSRICVHFGHLPVHVPGNIIFNLTLNGEHCATHTLGVRQNAEEES